MPTVDYERLDFTPEPLQMPEAEPDQSLGEIFGTSFKAWNPMYAAYNAMTKQSFEPDPTFDGPRLVKRLEESGRMEEADNFIGVSSDAEFDYELQRLQDDEALRQKAAAGGIPGLIFGVINGGLDPTLLLPFVGEAKGVRAFAQAAGYALLGNTAQELILKAGHPSQTTEETFVNIGTGTLLQGLLGGVYKNLSKAEIERLTASMDRPQLLEATPTPGFNERSVGAEYKYEDAGGIAIDTNPLTALDKGLDVALRPAALVMKQVSKISPIVRMWAQTVSPTARYIAGKLGDAGLVREGNLKGISGAVGGTVENRVKPYYSALAEAVDRVNDLYKQYYFKGGPQGSFATQRAMLGGLIRKDVMSLLEFRKAVGRAMWNNDRWAEAGQPVLEVEEAARFIRQKVYDPILSKALEAKILRGEDLDLKGDLSYLNRIYNKQMIGANTNEFIDILSTEYERKLQDLFQKRYEKFLEKTARLETKIADMSLTAEAAIKERDKWLKTLQDLKNEAPENVKRVEETISDLRKNLISLKKAGASKEELADIREEIKQQTSLGGEELKTLKMERTKVRRRISNLNKSPAIFSEKQAAKFNRIYKLEEMNFRSIEAATKASQKILSELSKYDEKIFKKEMKALADEFARVGERFDKVEEKIVKEAGDDIVLVGLTEKWQKEASKLNDIVKQMREIELLDLETPRTLIKEANLEMLHRTNFLNNRRARMTQKLMDAAKKLDPKIQIEALAKLTKSVPELKTLFQEAVREAGGEDFDFAKGTVSFKNLAKEVAQKITATILGTELRLPAFETIQGLRKSELHRMLDISSLKIAKFLENDVEKAMRIYIRTLAGDIELTKAFGDPLATDFFKKIGDEFATARDALRNAVDKKGKPLTEQVKQKELLKLLEQEKEVKRTLLALIGRIRHTWGVPQNPTGWGARAASTMLDLNTARLMGKVLVSSIADPGRVLQKHSLTKTLKVASTAYISGLKSLKLNAREAKLYGAALDPIIHSRSHAITDVMEDIGQYSKIERGIKFLSSKIGLVGLFDYWTSAWKQLAAGVVNLRLLDAIDITLHGGGTVAERKAASTLLAHVGLVGDYPALVWKELTNNEGGELINGVWHPNTANWTNKEVQQAFRAAAVGLIDSTIITPGIERPLMMDANLLGKLIFQFKSFATASTTKTIMAGLQQRDAAFVNGVMVSLALGALSYYLWSVATSNETYEEMQNADLGRWADEAIRRSGQDGIFGVVKDVAEKTPLLQKYASFSGSRTGQRREGDLLEALFGPTSNLLKNAQQVILGLDEPTKSTLHSLRLLLPYQNLIVFSRFLDLLEKKVNLPERRDQ